MFATADDPTPTVLCGQGPAPAGATLEHYRGLGLDLVPGSGPLAAAVPGAVDAWLMLLPRPRHAVAARRALLRRGLRAARTPAAARGGRDGRRDGADVPRALADLGGPLAAARTACRGPGSSSSTRRTPTCSTAWSPRARPPAATASRSIEAARRAWREGFVAEAVDAFQRRPFRDSSGADHAGVVTGADLAGWSRDVRAGRSPSVPRRRGREDRPVGAGPGAAPVAGDARRAARRRPRPVDRRRRAHDHRGAQARVRRPRGVVRRRQPGVRRRAARSGVRRERRALVGEQASAELRPGSPGGRTPRLPEHVLRGSGSAGRRRRARRADRARWTGETRGDTCHIDVVDRWGNIISATPSGGWLQSSPTVPGLGFCLGSRMQMFWLDDGLPSSLAPGRRPRTTLSPTLVLRDGRPVLACGTPGGDQQDQWQLLFLLRHLVGGQELQEAIDAPTFHTTSLPELVLPPRHGAGRAGRRGPARGRRASTTLAAPRPRRHPGGTVDAGPAVRGRARPGHRPAGGRGEPARQQGYAAAAERGVPSVQRVEHSHLVSRGDRPIGVAADDEGRRWHDATRRSSPPSCWQPARAAAYGVPDVWRLAAGQRLRAGGVDPRLPPLAAAAG